jgi:hypothetical protein
MPHEQLTRFRLRSFLCLALFIVVVIPGCGSDELDSPTAKKLKALSSFYMDYVVAHNGQGPTNEAEFKKYIRSLPDQVISPSGIQRSEIDTIFVSERDQQPIEVVYGRKVTTISGKSGAVVAHEKSGKGGKRLVALTNTKIELVDESEFQGLLATQP